MKLLVHDLTTGTTSHHLTVESATRLAGFLLTLGHNVRMERGDVPARPSMDGEDAAEIPQ